MNKWVPHPYQIRGMQCLIGEEPGGGLLFDPGLGKTSTATGAFCILKEKDPSLKMLVIAPIRPMYDAWVNEPQKWEDFSHLRVQIVHGPKKHKDVLNDADVYIINPEGVLWFFERLDPELRPKCQVLCVDESTKFKHSNTRRFKALKKHLHSFDRRWILTGTVCPNGLMDLFGQSFLMDQGQALERYVTRYRMKYFFKVNNFEWVPHEFAQEVITAKLSPRVIQLDAEDYLDMPDFLVIDRLTPLGKDARAIYDEIEKEFVAELERGDVVAANAAVAGNKCRQIANGFLYDDCGEAIPLHNHKVDALEEIVEETNGHPLLIVYEFKSDLRAIEKLLGDKAVCLTGLKGHAFQSVVERFNNGDIPYLLINSASAHGLNIQGACNHMVWFGLTWNLENYIQTNYRLYRQGQQSKQVFCYRIIASETKEQDVARALERKNATQDQINDSLKGPEHELQIA